MTRVLLGDYLHHVVMATIYPSLFPRYGSPGSSGSMGASFRTKALSLWTLWHLRVV